MNYDKKFLEFCNVAFFFSQFFQFIYKFKNKKNYKKPLLIYIFCFIIYIFCFILLFQILVERRFQNKGWKKKLFWKYYLFNCFYFKAIVRLPSRNRHLRKSELIKAKQRKPIKSSYPLQSASPLLPSFDCRFIHWLLDPSRSSYTKTKGFWSKPLSS